LRGFDLTWKGGEPVLGNLFSPKMAEVFGEPREPRGEITERDRDLAASVQVVLEEDYLALLDYVQRRTHQKTVCLAGGVALNCVANGMIFERTGFRDVYVQPAAHDAGTSIGAALFVHHQLLGNPRGYVMRHVYYGSEHSDSDMLRELDSAGVKYRKLGEPV